MIRGLSMKIDFRHVLPEDVDRHGNLKYVVEDRDRHGNVRIYFRKKGEKKVRLRPRLGSAAFWREYRLCRAGNHPAQLARKAKAKADASKQVESQIDPTCEAPIKDKRSLAWLCQTYFGDAEFLMLTEDTRTRRIRLLREFCITKKRGKLPFALMKARHVRRYRDELADRPHAANARIKAFRAIFNRAVEDELMEHNPALLVKYLRPKSTGYHTWTVEEVQQYATRHPLGSKAFLALALFLFTGGRRSDVHRLGRQMVRAGRAHEEWSKWIRFPVLKDGDDLHEIPFHPVLEEIIGLSPTGDLTFLVSNRGTPFTKESLGNKMREWCDEADLPHCSAHGLRKAGATILAEHGATTKEIMAIYKWENLKQAEHYTRAAERRRLSGSGMTVFPTEVIGSSVPLLGTENGGGTLSGSKPLNDKR